MADTIRIRRRTVGAAGAPASLPAAGLAYNEVDDTLYYGKGNNFGVANEIVAIGGPGAFAGTSHVHPPPSLDQITTNNAVAVSGADPSTLDGVYPPGSQIDGRTSYAAGEGRTLAWSAIDARWELGDSEGVKYVSLDDVVTPDLATTWGSVGLDALLVCQSAQFPSADGVYQYSVGDGRYLQQAPSGPGYMQWDAFKAVFEWEDGNGKKIASSQSAVTPRDWVSSTPIVAGSGEPLANVSYELSDPENGRPFYSSADGAFGLRWDGIESWELRYVDQGDSLYPDGTVLYRSTEDVSRPALCTAWDAVDGPSPAPTVTEPDVSVVVTPVPAPSLVVATSHLPAGWPITSDGEGGLVIAPPVSARYPQTLTAPTGWDTPGGLASGLLAALGLTLAPSDGEVPGTPINFHLQALPDRWGRLFTYIDFGNMQAEWRDSSMTIQDGDTVVIHGVTVSMS